MEGSLQVPGYTAIRRLGSADSSMWLGTDNATGQPVTLRPVRGDVQAVRDGLSSASLVMRALNHPHVVPFLNLVETAQGPVLILGAAEGGCLADVLVARRALPPGEMVTACAPIAEALAEMHQHGIVHGAITPDEVVFDRDGRPMLAGVGLATIGARFPLRGPTIAPEVASGAGGFAPAADVYSIAAMGVVALTGPIAGDQLFAASAERLLATGVAPAAQAVLTRAIGRNIGRRPDAMTLVNALYAVADPEPVELVVPEPEQPGPPPRSFTDPGAATGYTQPGTAHGAGGFETDPGAPDELDDVTAYMRQTSTPAPGRRARRTSEDTSLTDTAGSGRRARDRREGRMAPVEDQPRGHGRAAAGSAMEQPAKPPTKAPGRQPGKAPGRPLGRQPGKPPGKPPGKKGTKTGPAQGSGRTGGRRPSRGDLTRVASVLVVLLLAAGAVIIGMQIFGGEDELPEAGIGEPESAEGSEVDLCGGPRPAPDEEPPEVTDWTQEVQRLYGLRARAFEELDAELLCEVYAPTSEGLVRDVELMQEYADNGVRTQNLSFEVIDAELVEQNGGTVVLEISDRLPAYQLVNDDGEVVEEKPGMENETWVAELVPIAGDEDAAPTWRFG